MKELAWSSRKNDWLKKHRGVSFDDIIQAELIGVEEHPRRPHQRIMLFLYRGYVWIAPYVESPDRYFLKTLYPSRKYTRRYLGEKPLR